MEEGALLQRLKKRDPEALAQTIGRYGSYVTAIIRGRGHVPQDVEELTADVFFALWENAAGIKKGRLRPWLGQVARNKSAEHFRRNQRPPAQELEGEELRDDDDLCRRLSDREREARVREALKILSPTDQEIFYRYYDLEQNAKEIAEIMKIPHSTVRTRLSRGRRALKVYFEKGGMLDESEI